MISNSSFEEKESCPDGISEIEKATGWSGWRISPDYLNACCTTTEGTSWVGVPENFFGYQYAKSGEAYAGFYAYDSGNENIREMIGTQLIQPLTVGVKYYVKFFVSVAFRNDADLNGATNKLGAFFSMGPYEAYTNPVPVSNQAQVYSDSVISDTTNWVLIEGSLIADSAYSYVAFGNFFTDSATTFIMLGNSAFPGAYYFIDDVSVSTDSSFASGTSEIIQNEKTVLYPNPNNGEFAIQLSSDLIDGLVSVIDMTGRCLYSENMSVSKNKIINLHLENIPAGVYRLEIRRGDELSQTGFVIEKQKLPL